RVGERSVDEGTLPINLPGTIEFGQEQGVQLEPDSGSMPLTQVVAAGLAATTAHITWQIVPSDAGLGNKENAGEDVALVDGLGARKAKATCRGGGYNGSCAPRSRP